MPKKYKIAIVVTHVIQYMVPLYHRIKNHPLIDLTVYFCSTQGLIPKKDEGFGIAVSWDNINLDGLNYKFLKNYSPIPSVNTFFGLINFKIFKELKKNKFDAVVVMGYYNLSYWFAILACFFYKIPLILTGEPPTPFKSKIKRYLTYQIKRIFLPWVLSFCSAVLYIGKKSKEYYLSYKRHVNDLERKLFFSPYSVDNDYFFKKYEEFKDKREAIKKELGLPLDLPIVLFLSKLIKWKRPLILLEAKRYINKKFILLYVGTGYRLKALKEYVSKHKIDNVYFSGFQNYSQISKFYAISDIFVLPSLGEAWGLVINEAMCFGLPVITTNKVNSSYDLIKNGINGYIIPANDLNALIKALDELLSNPYKMKIMGRASQEIISGWSYTQYIDGLLQALEFIEKNKLKNICIPY